MLLFAIFDALVSPEGTVQSTGNVYTTFNSSQNLTCVAEGGPNNTFEWRRQAVLVSNMSVLEFPMITGDDGSVYQCIVRNAAGSDSATTLLSGTHMLP